MSVYDHGFAGVTIWPIRDGRLPIVEVEPGPLPIAPETESRIEGAWSRLVAANRRLFDGPILSLARFEPESGRVVCRPDRYKRLTVEGEISTGVILVAVNAAVTACDRAGREHLLLGRRSENTRMYQGMWEMIPAGGLEPPPAGTARVPHESLLRQLAVELREEAGLNTPLEKATPIAFYRDEVACSFNIVFSARLSVPIEEVPLTDRDWDCDAVWWLGRDEAGAFLEGMPVIAPSRALLRMLGWGVASGGGAG